MLAVLNIPFLVHASDADESYPPGSHPQDIVETLSLKKARTVAELYKNELVIGSDTIVVLGDAVLGKPDDKDEAFQMLSKLQGRVHEVYSGVAVVDAANGYHKVGHTVSKVTFRPMTGGEITGYINTGEPMDKAGSYGVQGLGAVFIEKIEGDFYSVMGLPLNLLYQMLLSFGIDPLD